MGRTSEFAAAGSRFGEFTVLGLLHRSERSLVLRCLRGEQPAVVKFLRADALSAGAMARFRREYELSCRISHRHVVSASQLGSREGVLFMAMPDDAAVSLRELLQLQGALPVRDALRAACAVVDALEAIHQRRLIHKDIAPGNIIANFATDTVKLIDFGIAAEIQSERPELARPEDIEGTLTTMAPEQSGRMNRDVDYRADFYALGATLFELLAGGPPFRFADPVEAVHAHLTHAPPLTLLMRPEIPPVLVALVGRLLAKEPEARYQSHFALRRDLQHILAHLDRPAQLLDYRLAAADLPERFQVSGRLYGRAAEVEKVLHAFEAAAAGQARLITIAGFSGIGKTALVNEVQRALLGYRGNFVGGKYNQFGQHSPYAAFIAALQQRGRQLLAQRADARQRWCDALLATLGANAALVAAAVPDLALLLGPLPPVLPLGPTEAENRLMRTMQQSFAALASADEPLVLFIDDLQWADRASRRLLRELAQDEGLRHLLVIGAYRSNEITPDHPLAQDLQGFAELGPRSVALEVGPLSLADTGRLLADSLYRTPDEVAALAALCQAKTGGNPFFLRRFLEDIARRRLVWLDRSAAGWSWSIEKIEQQRMADNVVELMVEQLRRLPAETAGLLTAAACLGARFELATLATATGRDEGAALRGLVPALEASLLVPVDRRYKWVTVLDEAERAGMRVGLSFAHDRVQEAAYSLATLAERPALHLRIGRLLRSGIDPQRPDFAVVNHLNLGAELMDDAAERVSLAALNAQASRLAQDAAAFELAADHAERAISLYGDTRFADALALHLHAARMAYLAGRGERMDALIAAALPHARQPVEQAMLMDVRIESFYAAGRLHPTLELGLEALALLGTAPPAAATLQEVAALVAEVRAEIEALGLDVLAERPPMRNAMCLQQLSIIAKMTAAAYIAQPALLPLLTVMQVRLMLAHGTAPVALSAYSVMGLMVSEFLGDYDFGYRLGRMSMNLIERHGWPQVHAHAGFSFNAFLRHWVEPVAQGLPALLEVSAKGQEFGNLRHAGLALYVHGYHALLAGETLPELAQQLELHAAVLRRIRQPVAHDYLSVLRETLRQLQRDRLDTEPLENPEFSMRALQQTYAARSDQTGQMFLHAFACLLHALAGRHAQAEAEGLAAAALFTAGRGMYMLPFCIFFTAGASLALARQHPGAEADARRARVAEVLPRFERWARHNTELTPLWRLLRADLAALDGDPAAASTELDRALLSVQSTAQSAARSAARSADRSPADASAAHASVQSQGNLFMLGLVHRQRAEALAALGAPGAEIERAEAGTSFLRWGARALAAGLRPAEPAATRAMAAAASSGGSHAQAGAAPLPAQADAATEARADTHAGTQAMAGSALDLATLTKAVQAITAEIALGPLLGRMLYVLRENAGAQRAVIVLKDAEDWTLYADSEKDGTTTGASAAGGVVEPAGADPAPGGGTAEAVKPLEEADDALPLPILRTVLNSASPILIDDLQHEARWNRLDYFSERGGRSILCLPLVRQGQVAGALYLENPALAAVFSPQRIAFLGLLCGNVVNAIENARLYQQLRRQADLLEQRVAERTRELSESEARTLSILQNAPVPMTVTRRRDGVLVYANAPAAAVVGFTRETLVGHAAQTRWRDASERERMYAEYRAHGVLRDFEACLLKVDGSELWTLISMVPIVYDGEPAELATIIDIHERKAMEQALRRLASTDALTGVANRGHFMQRAASELERARRYGRPLAMVMLDIDHFKQINDRHGHSTGDEAIRALTAGCTGLVRQQDLVGRLGGEEFGILMPETDLEAAHLLAERLRVHIAKLRVTLPAVGDTLRMTASFGVSALLPAQDNVDDLLARADRALYVSKRNGRDRVSMG